MGSFDDSDQYSQVAEYYDHVTVYRDRQDVAFFIEMAKHATGHVLEIGCGTGRVLLPTAQAGKEIVGVDASPRMLAACRTKLAQESAEVQSRVKLVQADMRDFDLGKKFGLITIPFRPFQHLTTVEDQLKCLAAIHRHLAMDGKFILDIFNPRLESLVEPANPNNRSKDAEFTMPDGRNVARYGRIVGRDQVNQIQDVELIYDITYPDGRKAETVHSFPMRYLFRYEAEHLLARAGFTTEAVYADYDKSPYGSKYPGELIFVARKS